ncbi:AbiV family abortive infection protein [bacterium]|nr:MAG: AbiV family abortive infection protein [bacterium]
MEPSQLKKYIQFRKLCIKNSEDALRAAELLHGQNVNHILFHLCVLALEELGKIFVGWYQLNAKEKWDKEKLNIPIDDHVKKLFWAIWGPSFTREKITKVQIEDINKLATELHSKRLYALYTDLDDSIPSSAKISDSEAMNYLGRVKARLELIKHEGEIIEELEDSVKKNMEWFIAATNDEEYRKFIFGDTSQAKLAELGDVKSWVQWLQEYFNKEEQHNITTLKTELEKGKKLTHELDGMPKWKIKFTIFTPSHSIRSQNFRTFNEKNNFIKFNRGGDNHTLIIEVIISNQTPIQGIWQHGWTVCKVLVASLNVGTNGIFYWNIPVDSKKYFDKIFDLENKKELKGELIVNENFNWQEKKLVLGEDGLFLTFLVFRYFSSVLGSKEFEPVDDYATGLSMFAKSDIHLRFEHQAFFQFFMAFEKALMINEKIDMGESLVKEAYKQIYKYEIDESEFKKVFSIGEQMKAGVAHLQVTEVNVIEMKQYVGLYFVTLATRKFGSESN